MEKKIPQLTFRIEPGYTFEQDLVCPCIDDQNLLIGSPLSDEGAEAIFIGKIAEYGKNKNIWIDSKGAHAIYVMGKRRSGKTYTLGVFLEGLASSSWIRRGNENQAIIMLDTMNVFVTMPHTMHETYDPDSHQVKELKKWELEQENLNIILFYPRGTSPPPEGNSKEIAIKPSDLSGEDWAALFGYDTYSDPIGQLISDLYEKVVLEGYEDRDGNFINSKHDYSIDDLLKCSEICLDIINGYHADTIRAVKARFRAIKRLLIFSDSGIKLEEIFSPGQISIILLRDLEHNLRSLLVGVLVKNIMEMRSISDKYERLAQVHKERYEALKSQNLQDLSKKEYEIYLKYLGQAKEGLPRGWIIIDEAHNYIPAKGITASGEPLKKYVNEGRNLGLSIVVATQNPSALDNSIRRNADILIIHSMSMKDDISAAEAMINTFLPDSFEFGRENICSRVFEQLVRSLPLGYAVISNDRTSRIFISKIRPRLTVHGGIDY